MCINKGYKFEQFEEIFDKIVYQPSGKRRCKYFYILKKEWT